MTVVATPPKPSILDKLLGGAIEEGSRPHQHFAVPRLDRFGERELRMVIQRDIALMLNDIQFEATTALDDYPEVRTSVLNHGLPEMVGRSLDRKAMLARAGEITAALRAFEQRLRPDTIRVTFDTSRIEEENKLHFSIGGEIRNAVEESWVQFVSTVDLDDGRVEVAAS
jgi:type VI secretion system protein ImpF